LDGRNLGSDGFHISLCERLLVISLPDAALLPSSAALNLQNVLSQACALTLNKLLRAFTKRDHGDDRRHADDDSEHGERRLNLVLPQSVNRHLLNVEESHC